MNSNRSGTSWGFTRHVAFEVLKTFSFSLLVLELSYSLFISIMVAERYNSASDFPTETDMMPIEYVHRGPSTRIYASVADAPATNPINIVLTRVP